MKRKHTLRSLLSMVCTIAMIVSMVPVLPAAAAADVFYDTMESYTVGTDLYTQAGDKYTKTSPAWGNSNFTAAAQGSVAVVADPTNSGNKVLAVTAAGQSKRYVLTVGPKVTGDYTLQFDYMSPTAVSNVGSGFLDIYINDGRNQIARVNYRTYGSYFYLDGASASPMAKNADINEDNTWYSVRVVVSEDEYTMDIWEKGNPDTKISTTATKNQKANAGTNVEFCFGPYDSAWGMDTSKPITNYIDNIRITPGVVEASASGSGSAAGGDDVAVSGGGMVSFADADKIVNKEAVAITAGMGIFAGKEGNNFDPAGVLTRAEMATIIVKMLRGNAFNADNFKGYNKFSDTADYQGGWAEGYINACVQMGIVAGYGDGTFKPGNSVTTAEALTMIINALKVDAGEGSWPATIMAKAQEMKLYGDLAVKPGTNDALTRDQLAVLVYEGMCYSPSGVTGYKIPGVDIVFTDIADAMKANNGVTGITEVVGEDALANKVYELKIAEGYIVSNQANSDNEYTVVRTVKDDGSFEDTLFNMETKLEEIGHYVTVYYREAYKNEKEPGVVYNYVDETQVVTVDEAISTSKDYKAAFTKSIKTAKRVAELDAAYDWQGTNTTLSGYTAGSAAKTGTYFIYEGEIVGYMPLVPEYAAKVRAVNKFDGNETIELSGVATPISNSEDNDRIQEYSGIKKDDFVTYVKVGTGANETYILTKVTTAKGVVEKTSTNEDGDDVITIKGVDYVEFGGTNNVTEFKTLAKPNYTDSYTLYVTADGEFIGYEKTEGGLDLNETVFILGELVVDADDGYGGKVRKTTARGVDMTGKEVNLLLKVEKNGTIDANGNYFPSMNADDTIAAPTYAPLTPNTFYTYELSNDKDAKKEGIYVLEALPSAYNKDTAPVYTGTRTISNGDAYGFSNFSCNGKNTYYHSSTVYMLLEGSLGQTTPLTAEVKKSWATSTNTSGAPMYHYYILSRNESDNQMLDVALVIAEDAKSAAGTQVVYVSAENRAPAGTNADGYVYDVYDYKTGAKKQITLKNNDPLLTTLTIDGRSVAGCIPTAGYWHTIPEADTSCSILVEKVVDTGTFTGTTSNSSANDKLYTENIAHDQLLVELANDELNTTAGTRLRKASGSIVVDVRSEEDITAAGIGKISSVDRLGTLAVDNPEVTVVFDLCYSSTSSKMHTIFIKDVYFTSVEGGSEIINSNGTYYLDGRVVASDVQITDNSGRLQTDVSGTNDTAALNELAGAIANNKTVNVSYTMENGKVNAITVTGILAADELYVETFEGYAAGSMGQALPASLASVWITESGDYEFEIVNEGGNKVFKATNEAGTKRRVWVKPNITPTGNYTFETKIKIGDTNSTFDLRFRNINHAGTTNNYTLRVYASGDLNNVYDGGKMTTLTRNAWYKVVITVDESNGKVKAEIFDNAGATIATRESACDNFAGHETIGPTIDFNGAGVYYVDDIIITQGAAIAPAATYTVTANRTDANGLISVDKTSAKAGETITVTTTAKAGYKLDQLLVNGSDVLANNDDLNTTVVTTFTMPAQNTTVEAKFAAISSFNVSVDNTADTNGTVVADKTGAVKEGEVITITATPANAETYSLKSIKVNGVEIANVSPATYTMVDENAVITAEFEIIPYYAVTKGASINGSLSFSGTTNGAGNFKKGSVVTVNAAANSGYELVDIYVNGAAIEGNTFTVTEEGTTVSAEFKPEGAVFYDGFGTYTVGETLPVGDAVNWSKHGTTTANTTYTVETENGGPMLKLTAKDAVNDTYQRVTIKTTEKYGDSYVIRARVKTDAGYVFAIRLFEVNLPRNNSTQTGNAELRITKNSAYFYLFAANASHKMEGDGANDLYLRDGSGDVVTLTENTWYDVEFTVDSLNGTVRAELKNGSGFAASRELDGADVKATQVWFDLFASTKTGGGAITTACVDEVSITPLVIPESDVTVAAAPAGCTVTVDKDTAVKAGETVTITANYDADVYKAPTFTVTTETGGNVTVTGNKFTMPGENVTVTANFTAWANSAVNTSVADENGDPAAALGTISVSPAAATHKEGTQVTVTVNVTDSALYYVSGVEVNNGAVAVTDNNNGTYTFTMPGEAADVVATIKAKAIYSVTGYNGTYGSVTAAGGVGEAGATVTLNVVPQTGYELHGTPVVTGVSGTVTVTEQVKGQTYTFTMPDEEVSVTATFWPEGTTFLDDFDDLAANSTFDSTVAASRGYAWRKVSGTPVMKIVSVDGSNALSIQAPRVYLSAGNPTSTNYTLEFDLHTNTLATDSVTDILLGSYAKNNNAGNAPFYIRIHWIRDNIGIYGTKTSAEVYTNSVYAMGDGNDANGNYENLVAETWYHFKAVVTDANVTLYVNKRGDTANVASVSYTFPNAGINYDTVTNKVPVMFDHQATEPIEIDNVIIKNN